MNSEISRGWRLGLLGWVLVAGALMAWAPRPSMGPAVEPEELAVWERTAARAAADARNWQVRSGDVVVPWEQAEGHLAIVIDDVGRELHVMERLLALRYRLTFAILPDAVYAAGAQLRISADSRRRREILVHLPMEPAEARSMEQQPEPVENVLLVEDSPAALRRKVERALDRVPLAVGVNNHMGSRFTTHPDKMDVVMDILARRGLYFLDSRTTAETVALERARQARVPAVSRAVFLDHDPSPAAIRSSFRDAVRRSLEGPVVAIGHPSPALVRVLEQELPVLERSRIGVYPLSFLVRPSPGPDMSHP